jgi:hypothetical protein
MDYLKEIRPDAKTILEMHLGLLYQPKDLIAERMVSQ